MCFVQVVQLKLFRQFCRSKKKQFCVDNSYKAHKSRIYCQILALLKKLCIILTVPIKDVLKLELVVIILLLRWLKVQIFLIVDPPSTKNWSLADSENLWPIPLTSSEFRGISQNLEESAKDQFKVELVQK